MLHDLFALLGCTVNVAAVCRLVAAYRAAHGFPPRARDLGLEPAELDALVASGVLVRVPVVDGGPEDFVALTDEGLGLARAAALSVSGPRARAVACPVCAAPAGAACRSVEGTNRLRRDGGEEFLVHSERWELARQAS